MTQNEKDLLLKDLCARLPYGVMAKFGDSKPLKITNIGQFQDSKSWFIESDFEIGTILSSFHEVKPYLFPLSSMTDEQKIDLTKYLNARVFIKGEISFECLFANSMDRWGRVFEWCNKNHFDYRGLIPMGLANDATGLNIY